MRNVLFALAVAGSLATLPAHSADLWSVYQLALRHDPTYAEASATYQAARENEPIARAGYLPNIVLTGSRQRSETTGNQIGVTTDPNTGQPVFGLQNFTSTTYDTNYNVQLTQPLFNWGAWETIRQANASVAEAEAQFVAAQQDLIVRTATAYFNVITARDTLATDHAATLANAKQLELAKAQYQVGVSAITNVQVAQAAYDLAISTEIGAQQQVINAEESLRAITGRPVGVLQEPLNDMPLRMPAPDNAQKWVSEALKQNPNLLAAQAAAQVAATLVSIKRSGHYPTLNFVAQRNKNNASGNNIFDLSNTNGTIVGLQLSFPIFSGGAVSAEVTQAERQYDASQDQVEFVTRQTVQQTRTSYLGVLTGISQVQALRQSVKSNETALQATKTGMRVGTRTIVDVLLSLQNLVTAQTGFAQSRDNYLTSVLALKQAAGILSPLDVKQINALLVVPAPRANMTLPAGFTGQHPGNPPRDP